MARPLVGITTYVVPARFGAWELDSALVPHEYVLAVQRAGGRPLLVPPSTEGVEETLDALDGLIFSGGSDLGPDLYGQEAHPETTGVVPERDSAELALLEAALERDLPVLAICRGSQVLNVALGGDLVQHIPDVVGTDRHKQVAGTFADHEVKVAEGMGCKAIRVSDSEKIGDALKQARALAREFRTPVVVEVILERVTNIAMGTEIDNIVEFEDVLGLPLDETPVSAVAMPKEKLEPV